MRKFISKQEMRELFNADYVGVGKYGIFVEGDDIDVPEDVGKEVERDEDTGRYKTKGGD